VENTWLFLVLGALSFFVAMSTHHRIQRVKRNPFGIKWTLNLEFERMAYLGFGFVFFVLFLVK